MKEITVTQLHNLLKENPIFNLIDVRTRGEFEMVHIKDSQLIELEELLHNNSALDKQAIYYLICRTGNRSGFACQFLEQFNIKAINISGGIVAWQNQGFPIE